MPANPEVPRAELRVQASGWYGGLDLLLPICHPSLPLTPRCPPASVVLSLPATRSLQGWPAGPGVRGVPPESWTKGCGGAQGRRGF